MGDPNLLGAEVVAAKPEAWIECRAMIRLLAIVILLGIGFAGGFYTGIHYRNEELRENPEEFLRLHADKLGKSAKEKYEKVKKVLLD